MTEGRRRFRDVLARIDRGDECERYAPILLALAEGSAISAAIVELRPHLRHCGACRATVRELAESRRHRALLMLPFVAGLAPARWLGARVADPPQGRVEVKSVVQAALHRLTASDMPTTVQMASSGGGRGPAVAALLGLCLSGGAGTYCLATGTLPDPARMIQRERQPAPHKERHEAGVKPPQSDRTPTTTASTRTEAPRKPVAIATQTVTPAPKADRSQTSGERRQRSKPSSETPQREFSFESSAAEPVTGGGGAAPTTAVVAASSQGSGDATPSTASSSQPPTSGGEFLP